jgi:hypothetical protein
MAFSNIDLLTPIPDNNIIRLSDGSVIFPSSIPDEAFIMHTIPTPPPDEMKII